ncbi:MAG: hypothetical protein WC820_00270 [Spirochaetales bacterium]|jgi:hypothetical protein
MRSRKFAPLILCVCAVFAIPAQEADRSLDAIRPFVQAMVAEKYAAYKAMYGLPAGADQTWH